MKMCLIPTFLTPASRDHLHMCLSKMAQAGQVSPVCEIKLAAVLIDLNVQKARKPLPDQTHLEIFFFFFSPLSGTSGELGWLPARFVTRLTSGWQAARTVVQCTLDHLVVTLTSVKCLRTKQTAQAIFQEFAPRRIACQIVFPDNAWQEADPIWNISAPTMKPK